MTAAVIDLLESRYKSLLGIIATRDNWLSIEQWHSGARPLFATRFQPHLEAFDKILVRPRWMVEIPDEMVVRGRRLTPRAVMENNDKLVDSVKRQLLGLMTCVMDLAKIDQSPASASPPALTNNVFIVHGHDGEMKQHMARVLTMLGLNPIILHEQPNGGKTLIEKFEKNADVGYAVVLLSADDKGYCAKEGTKGTQPRARQNVILELGYFVGRLGREKVFALRRDEFETPSDIIGVTFTQFDAPGRWEIELVRELKHAGYDVTADSLLPKKH